MGISTDEAFEIASQLFNEANVYCVQNMVSIHYRATKEYGFGQFFQKGEKKGVFDLFNNAQKCVLEMGEHCFLIKLFFTEVCDVCNMRRADKPNRPPKTMPTSEDIRKGMEQAILEGRSPYIPSIEFRKGEISVEEEGLNVLKWLDERMPVYNTLELSKLQKWNELNKRALWMKKFSDEVEISPPNPKGHSTAYILFPVYGKMVFHEEECICMARLIEISDIFEIDGGDLVFSIEDIYS